MSSIPPIGKQMSVNNSHDGLSTREDGGPELVIFDSDGVLVDSEPITGSVLVSLLEEVGYHTTAEHGVKLCRGRKMADIIADIQSLSGIQLSDDFIAKFRLRVAELFRTDLRPIAGIREVLEGLELPHCVASSGPNERIEAALGATGLLRHFEGRIFSAYDIQSWKPDPGLFLHAASKMGAEPANCTVVEDTPLGVTAAIAAGMRALGYAAVQDDVEPLREAGAVIFRSMRELPSLLYRV